MTLDLTADWTTLPVVVLDFEATSADPLTCEPIEVAAVRFEGGKVVAEFSTLLDPGVAIPAGSTAIHGITDEMVAGKPRLAMAAKELREICDGAVPVAYNAPFDRTVLHRYLAGVDAPAFDTAQGWIDVFVIIASENVDKYVAGSGRLKLATACKRWDVQLDGAHRALADCVATGELLFKLLEKGMVKACPLGRLLGHTDQARRAHEADYEKFVKRIRADERVIWRQYACAALAGAIESPEIGVFSTDAGRAQWCGKQADLLLALEKEKFL